VTADVKQCQNPAVSFRKFDRLGERFFVRPGPFRQIALGIDRGLDAFRRGQRKIDAGVPEHKLGCREFLQPEARLSPGGFRVLPTLSLLAVVHVFC